jgi:hypothetical protein
MGDPLSDAWNKSNSGDPLADAWNASNAPAAPKDESLYRRVKHAMFGESTDNAPGLTHRLLNRAAVSTERMGADIINVGIGVVNASPIGALLSAQSAMRPKAAGNSITKNASALKGSPLVEGIRKHATQLESTVPEAKGALESIASVAGYILPDVVATMLGTRGVKAAADAPGLIGKASAYLSGGEEATGALGALRRSLGGAAAAAPLTTVPRAIAGEKGESATEMLTGTTNPLFKLGGDIGIDVLGGTVAELLTAGGAKAAANFLKKKGASVPQANEIIAKAEAEIASQSPVASEAVAPVVKDATSAPAKQIDAAIQAAEEKQPKPKVTGRTTKIDEFIGNTHEPDVPIPDAEYNKRYEEIQALERKTPDAIPEGGEPPANFADKSVAEIMDMPTHPDKSLMLTPEEWGDRGGLNAWWESTKEQLPKDRRAKGWTMRDLEMRKAMFEHQLYDARANAAFLEMGGIHDLGEEMSTSSRGGIMWTPEMTRASKKGARESAKRASGGLSSSEIEAHGYNWSEDAQGRAADIANRLGWDISHFKEVYEDAIRASRESSGLEKTIGIIDKELQKRTSHAARIGSASPAVVSTIGSAGAGAALGAVSTPKGEESDTLERAMLGGFIGAGLGGLAGRKLSSIAAGKSAGGAVQSSIKKVTGDLSAPLMAGVDRLEKTAQRLKRETPFAGEIDASDYVNAEMFSGDPQVQQRLLDATEQVTREMNVELRAPKDMEVNGKTFKKGELLNRESLDHVRAAAAAEMGINPSDVASRTAKGERIGRVDVLRVKTAINNTLKDEDELLKRLADTSALTKDEVDVLNLTLGRVQNERNVLIDTFIKQGTQAARDLNAFKISALKNGDPDVWLIRLQKLAGRPLTDDETRAARIAGGNQDIDSLMKLAQELRKSTWQEKVATWVKAGMLTSPKTHIANIGGNTTMQALESAKDLPAAIFDKLLSIRTGIRTKDFDAIASGKSSLKGAIESKKAVMDALRGKKDLSAGLDAVREVTYDNALANIITKGVFRSLGAADEFFKSVSFARSIGEQARVMAKAEKLVDDELTKRIAHLTAAPTDEMVLRAAADAAIATFQDDTWLSKGAIGMRKWMGLPGDLLFPFAKTPANIASRIADYGPIGFAKELFALHKVLSSGTPNYALQKKVVEGLGRATIGGAAITVGYFAAKNGRMTGFFPSNPRERNAWESSGKMEGSIKVGDNWVQVSKLSPLGNLLQVGASLHDMENEVDTDASLLAQGAKAVYGGLTSPLRSVAELPMVANVNDLTETIGKAGSDEMWDATARIAGRQVSGLIPFSGLSRSLAQATDQTVRETKAPTVYEATKNTVKASIPGLSRTLPERLDPLGRTQQRDLGVIGSLFSPVAVRKSLTTDPMRAELERTNAVITPVKRRKDETPQMFLERKRMTGSTMDRVMRSVTSSPQYKAIGDMSTDNARALLENAGVSSEGISDERIRSRLQGAMLERIMDRAKSAIYRAQPKTIKQRASEFSKSITRR